MNVMGLPDIAFGDAWRELTVKQRQEIGPAGFDRYRKLSPYNPEVLERQAARVKRLVDRDAQTDRLKAKRLFPRVWLNDAQVNPESVGYFIKGLLEQNTNAVIYGETSSGKTFATIDLVCHVAAGIPWRQKRVRQGLVVYVAAEAGDSIQRRFVAWRDRHIGESREERIPLAIVTRAVNLLDQVQVAELIASLESIAQEAGMPIGLVIFDTLSRSIPGGDENGSKDITAFVGVCDRVRSDLGAATLTVHHSGKDKSKGARGHSALEAAADTVLSVDQRRITVEKVRDGTAGETFGFELEAVELGLDQDGDKLTTCVVVPAEGSKAQKTRKMTADETLTLSALREVATPLPQTTAIPAGKVGARVEDWRKQFYARLGESRDVEKDSKRRAFDRGKKGLLAKKLVEAWETYAWIG